MCEGIVESAKSVKADYQNGSLLLENVTNRQSKTKNITCSLVSELSEYKIEEKGFHLSKDVTEKSFLSEGKVFYEPFRG